MRARTWRSHLGTFSLPDDIPGCFKKNGHINDQHPYSGLVNQYIIEIRAERGEQPKEVRNMAMPSFIAWVNAKRPHDLQWGKLGRPRFWALV